MDNARRSNEGTVSPKRIVFAVLGLVTLVTIYEHETPLLKASNPEWEHIAPFRWWLFPHILTVALALILGPLQFSSRIRRQNVVFHHWIGRLYVCSALVASSIALYIGVFFEIPDNRWLMGTMAGLWLVVTAFGWFAARNRDIAQHKLWFIRSYCLALTFVGTRFIPDLILPGMGYAGVTALYWVLIVSSLLVPDLLLNGRAILTSRKG